MNKVNLEVIQNSKQTQCNQCEFFSFKIGCKINKVPGNRKRIALKLLKQNKLCNKGLWIQKKD